MEDMGRGVGYVGPLQAVARESLSGAETFNPKQRSQGQGRGGGMGCRPYMWGFAVLERSLDFIIQRAGCADLK